MQHYINVRRIARLRQLSKIFTFGGIGLMVVALLISLRATGSTGIALGLSVIGLASSQLGTVMIRRWPERGRSDQLLDGALKGLDQRHSLYHYLLGCQHALFTPRGAMALSAVAEPGLFELREGVLWRTKIKRGVPTGNASAMGNLFAQAKEEASALQRTLGRRLEARETWEVLPVLVFVHPEARLHADGATPPTVHLKKLKDFVRNAPRRAPLTEEEARTLSAAYETFLLPG
ncbi:MAG TPA: hypothetical protein VJ160_07065 [Anaerolineales bacterium]|nr:hypothetical protein [Anaerolineales bacterium]